MFRASRPLALLFGLLLSNLAAAESVDQQLAEFRQRIETLERENAQLRQSLSAEGGPGPTLEEIEPAPATDVERCLAELELRLAHSEAMMLPDPCQCAPPDKDEEMPMTASWHHGLEIATKDKDYRVHIGGRTQFDVGWFDADQNVQDNINVPYEDGVDFRRARLRVDGTLDGWIEWCVEYDFVNAVRIDGVDRTVTAPTDLWWIFNDLPALGHVRVGNQKPAIGFEHLVSSRFLPFMERSYNQDTFYGGAYNGFWPGVSAFDTYSEDRNGTWNVGFFKPTDNVFAASAHDGDYAVVSRLTKLAWYDCEGASLLHLGVAGM